MRGLPYVRRRVYWAPFTELTSQTTASCPTCKCDIGMITVNNNDAQTQSCTWQTGITVAEASAWQGTLAITSPAAPIDALKSFLGQISLNVQHTVTTTITLSNTATSTQTYACQMVPNFQLGFYDQCELWQLHEIYDIVGPDQQPWSDPVYQVFLPDPIDNPLSPTWNSTYFDCRAGNNACVPFTSP